MNWYDWTLQKWRDLLERQPAVVNEKPNPKAVEILGNIDLLLRIAPQIGTAWFVRLTRWIIVPLATVILAYVMLSPCRHNGIRLSGTATAVSFTLDSKGEIPVLSELSLSKLVINPARALETSCEEKGSSLASSSLDHPDGTATIVPATRMRLDSFALPEGTEIYIGLAQRHQGITVVLSHPRLVSTMTGTASGLPGKASCSFVVKLNEPTVELTLQTEELEPKEPLYSQIPIKTAQFGRRDVELGRSVSSIISGALSFDEIAEAKYALDRGSRLSMQLWNGTLADFRVSRDDLSFLIQADASSVHVGYRDQRNITPTKLDWLRTKARNIELWLGLVYFSAILFGIGLPHLGIKSKE